MTSQIGDQLKDALQSAGHQVISIRRSEDGMSLVPPVTAVDTLINLAPLPAIDGVIALARKLGARRIIAFGSTGVFSKARSTSDYEREFVREQLAAERTLAGVAEEGMSWTLFRPTMIYGANADQNVTFIRSMIRRFHCFPMPFSATGMRQPVHVADLAAACVLALADPKTMNRAYNLGGGEVLPYADMVRRICSADRKACLIVPIPRTLYYLLISIARLVPSLRHLRNEMVDRMYADLVTDNTAAEEDFGYSPRIFDPPPSN